MEYCLLFLFIVLAFPFSRIVLKKYPQIIVPEIIWKYLHLTDYSRRDFYHSIFVFLVLLGMQYIPTLFSGFPLSIYLLFFAVALLIVMKTDWEKQVIPDFITVPFILLGVLFPFISLNTFLTPFDAALGGVIGYGLPAVLGLLAYPFRKNGLGAGDVKLLAMIGVWLGPVGLSYALAFGTLFFAAYSFKIKKRALPLAPFVGLGSLLFMAFHPIFLK